MPWRPLPRIAFAVATYPFAASSPADLPLELGDELYIIEQGGAAGEWYRGYLVAPPSLVSGLTSVKGQTLEARVFSGIFPRNCVEVREELDDSLVEDKASAFEFDNNTSTAKLPNGYTFGSQTSPQHSKSVLRNRSKKGSLRSIRSGVGARNNAQDSGVGSLASSSPSQHVQNQGVTQNLSRNLSQRSVLSLGSQDSALRLSPISGPTRDRPPAPVPMLKIGDETPTSASEPLVDEIASCLREWHSKDLHELLLTQRYTTLEQLADLIRNLDISRRQLLHDVLTTKELEKKRVDVAWDLVRGNKILGSEVIVRDPQQAGRLLTSSDSAVEVAKLQASMTLLDRPPVSMPELTQLYQLMFEVKDFANSGLSMPSLSAQLYLRSTDAHPVALTESYAIDVSSSDDEKRQAAPEKYKTLFTNLSQPDIGQGSGLENDLYLVVEVEANQETDQNPMGISRKESLTDVGPPGPDSHGSGAQPGMSLKRGRQSLMWAQKQLGSTRRRAAPDVQTRQGTRSVDPSPSVSQRSRSDTPQGLRTPTQQASQAVKRVMAVGVLDIKRLMAQDTSEERQLALWSPALNGATRHDSSNDNDQLLAEFLHSSSRRYTRSNVLGNLRVTLQSFACKDAEELVAKNPALLQGIPQTPKIAFSSAPTKPRSDIYLTLSEAHLPFKALLSHPERGPMPLPSSIDYNNVQLTLEVRKKSGERIERCIYPHANGQALTAWRTSAVDRGASWNQVVRLGLTEQDVPEAHLIMSIADAPGFPFALCWIPLWDQDAFIRDGLHAPLLYFYDKVTSSSERGRGAYLALPWNSKAKDDTAKDETFTGPIATVKLQTYLCSTTLSQDRVLAGLLKWRDQPQERLLGLLRQFTFVPETDIVKLACDLLNALFGVLVSNAGKDDFEELVFDALVTILGIVHDRRFNLGPLIDEYTESMFDFPFVTPCLIRSFLRLLARPADPQNSRRLHATIKVGRQMLRFITCARTKQKKKENAIGVSNDLSFRREYRSIFTALELVMQAASPVLVGSKTLIVQHIHTWLPTGNDTFSEDEVYQIVSSFIDSCSAVRGKLILYKLLLILHLSKQSVFTQVEVQKKFSASIEAWIGPYWGVSKDSQSQWRDQTRICCSIIARQSEEFGLDVSIFFLKVVESYASILGSGRNRRQAATFGLLFPMSYPFPTRPISRDDNFDEPLVELTALLAQCSGDSLKQALGSLGSANLYTIPAALDVLSSTLGGDAFPNEWLTLHVYYHCSALRTLETLHDIMVADLLPSPDDADDFNTAMWGKYFVTLLSLVGSKSLALETFAEQKRRAVWKIAGDVREQGANLLRRSWEAIGWESSPEEQRRYGVQRIGGFQVQYVPNLVSPIVELCLSVHEGLRRTAVRILQTMMISEWTLSEDLSTIEAEVIDCLDHNFTSKHHGESVTQKLFVNELLDLFEPLARIPGDGLWQAVKTLISTVDELLDLLAAVHSPESTKAVQIMHTLQLMDYLKDMRKDSIYIRYVHQLADVQAKIQNHTEAGLALQLHARLYQWIPETVGALLDPSFPEQTSFERKEQLYFEIIKHFEEGAAWDSALTTYKELAEQYEHHLYDFAKLARTQHSMARIYETIAKGERPSPRYFRVSYRGLGFPDSLRDKDFIFQGDAAERQAAFGDRLRLQHPSAQIVSLGDINDFEGQFLQISSVVAHRDLDHPLFQLSRVPQSVREHVLQSQTSRFATTSQRHSPATGVQDQWIEKTIYTTADAFPTILGRSEILSVEVVELSPLQTALERTSRKTSEIAALQKRIIDGDDTAFTSLTESIKSSVDPTSLSSVAQYRQFLPDLPLVSQDDEFDVEEPTLEPMQNALKQALLDHATMLRQCVALHTHPPHVNMHASLSESLQSTFAPELAFLAPAIMSSPPATSYGPQSPSLPPSRGFSSELPATTPLTNGITALPQPGLNDGSEVPPIARTRSRLSLGFLKPPSKANGSLDLDPSDSAYTPDDDSNSNASRPNGDNRVASQRDDSSANSLLPRPELGRMRSSHSSAATESERPMTAQSGRSGGMRKRLSLLGIGKGSVKSRSGGKGPVEVVEEE
ncbi:MAG: hypothetical protein Q9220_006600 [cf. Caloplaca sp. 1 TL-2023]